MQPSAHQPLLSACASIGGVVGLGCLVDPRLAPASTVAQEGEGEARHLSPARLLPLLELGEVPMGVVRALLRALAACSVLPEDWPQHAQRIRGAMQGGTACEECGEAVRVVFATPCGHLLCPDCTSRDSTACSHCRAPYKMQVGCCGRLAVGGGCCIWPDAWPAFALAGVGVDVGRKMQVAWWSSILQPAVQEGSGRLSPHTTLLLLLPRPATLLVCQSPAPLCSSS